MLVLHQLFTCTISPLALLALPTSDSLQPQVTPCHSQPYRHTQTGSGVVASPTIGLGGGGGGRGLFPGSCYRYPRVAPLSPDVGNHVASTWAVYFQRSSHREAPTSSDLHLLTLATTTATSLTERLVKGGALSDPCFAMANATVIPEPWALLLWRNSTDAVAGWLGLPYVHRAAFSPSLPVYAPGTLC